MVAIAAPWILERQLVLTTFIFIRIGKCNSYYIQQLGLALLSFPICKYIFLVYIGSVKVEGKRGQNSRTGKLHAKTRRVSYQCVLQRSTIVCFNNSGNLKRPWTCYKVTLML